MVYKLNKLPEIVSLLQEGFPEQAVDAPVWESALNNPATYHSEHYVNDKLVGFVYCVDGLIGNLVVKKDYRKQGIATMMITKAIKECENRGWEPRIASPAHPATEKIIDKLNIRRTL